MGNNWSCAAVTGILILSAILGVIGIALVETLIGIIPGLIMLLISGILFVIGLLSLIGFLASNRGKGIFNNLSWWCIVCIIVSTAIIIGEIVIAAKYFGPQPANPEPSNAASTQPATQT
jgi:hypothetical protein